MTTVLPLDILNELCNILPVQYGMFRLLNKDTLNIRKPKISKLEYYILSDTKPNTLDEKIELQNYIMNDIDYFHRMRLINIINDVHFILGNNAVKILKQTNSLILNVDNYRKQKYYKFFIQSNMKLDNVKILYQNDKYLFDTIKIENLMDNNVGINILDYLIDKIKITSSINIMIAKSNIKYTRYLINKFGFNDDIDNIKISFQYGNSYVFLMCVDKYYNQLKNMNMPEFIKSFNDSESYISCLDKWIELFGLNKEILKKMYKSMCLFWREHKLLTNYINILIN